MDGDNVMNNEPPLVGGYSKYKAMDDRV